MRHRNFRNFGLSDCGDFFRRLLLAGSFYFTVRMGTVWISSGTRRIQPKRSQKNKTISINCIKCSLSQHSWADEISYHT